ncbi:hypothetical protein K1X84_05540 [bacterium]|nr:hypothetical protein [bacterium]
MNFKILIFLFAAVSLAAQDEIGLPSWRYYTNKEYDATPQNWYFTQDQHGLVYVANSMGVLMYDGVRWETINVPSRLVRSVAADDTGRVWVGAFGDFGYLHTDAVGRTRYVSLKEFVPDSLKKFSDVWCVVPTPHRIYFSTDQSLFVWNGQSLKIIPGKYGWIANIEGTVYISKNKSGLLKAEGDSLIPIPGTESTANDNILSIFSWLGKIFLFDGKLGLLFFDGKEISEFSPSLSQVLLHEWPNRTIVLPNNQIAVSTYQQGIAVIDSAGKITRWLNTSTGFVSDDVKSLFLDREGGLWAGLENGIARVALSSPSSYFNESMGLKGTVESMCRWREHLFVGTGFGAYRMDGGSHFEKIPGIDGQCFDFLNVGDAVIAATGDGIFEINDHVRKLAPYRSAVAAQSVIDPNLALFGLKEGLAVIERQNGQWINRGLMPGIHEQIRSIKQIADGSWWLGTLNQTLIRLKLDSHDPLKNPVIERFGEKHGLPTGQNRVFIISNKLFFGTEKGIKTFDGEKFIPDTTFGSPLADGSHWVYDLYEDYTKNVWIIKGFGESFANEIIVAYPQPDGRYVTESKPFLEISQYPIYRTYAEPDGIVWLGGPEGLIRYDTHLTLDVDASFSALIRKAAVRGDSAIARGTLDFLDNALRFEYAATSYVKEASNLFQYKLEGFDPDWSEWTNETRKDYTNIPEGRYRFLVRARNIYGNISEPAVFEFRIKPPWYRTGWIYALYTFTFVALAYGMIRWRLSALKKQTMELESKVEERTAALESARREIEAQRDYLKSVNVQLEAAIQELKETQIQLVQSEKMASVGQMVAGLAHEINNPLTFVIPNLDLIQSRIQSFEKLLKKIETDGGNIPKTSFQQLDDFRSAIESAKTGSERIKNIVHNLRTFTNYDAHGIAETEIEPHLNQALDLFFNQYADIRFEKSFTFNRTVSANIQELNLCFVNILSNAVLAIHDAESRKLINEGEGRILITTEPAFYSEKNFVKITFKDNGIGISPEVLPHIFEPFFTTRPVGDGKGLGLSETYAIVKKYGGEIEVENNPEGGTSVAVLIPEANFRV